MGKQAHLHDSPYRNSPQVTYPRARPKKQSGHPGNLHWDATPQKMLQTLFSYSRRLHPARATRRPGVMRATLGYPHVVQPFVGG